jgi:hypothetical protein
MQKMWTSKDAWFDEKKFVDNYRKRFLIQFKKEHVRLHDGEPGKFKEEVELYFQDKEELGKHYGEYFDRKFPEYYRNRKEDLERFAEFRSKYAGSQGKPLEPAEYLTGLLQLAAFSFRTIKY